MATASAPAAAAAAPGTEPAAPKKIFFGLISPTHLVAVRNFMRILSYATTLDKINLALSSVAAVATGLTMPLMVIVFAKLIGIFTDFYRQGSTQTGDQFSSNVNQCVFYIIYLFAARLVFCYIANLGYRVFSLRISAAIRVVYLRSLFSLPISVLDAIPSGQTAAIITVTANLLQMGISEKLGGLFSSVSVVWSAVVIAFIFNWLLTLVTIAGLVFIGLVYAVFTPLIGKKFMAVHDADIKAASVAAEALGSMRMVAACGAEKKMERRYEVFVDESWRKGLGMAWLVASQQALVFFGVYATFALAFWFAFRMYMVVIVTTPESLIVVLLCVMMMASSIGSITAPLASAQQAAEACAIFHTIIDAPKPIYGTAKGEAEGVRADGDILLANVNFAYPTRPDVKVLDDLTLFFPAGKVTAIVGPSGSGKSTIVGVLERWYEFNGHPELNPIVLFLRNGWVSVGGRLLAEIDIKWWRNQIGLVQQDNVLFNTTIYKNVEHGLVGTQWEHESDEIKAALIRDACKDAFADEFISRLPDGYQTTVGESGIKLSGGQRQRLAIARAIVKQPKILILDEATSAIDVRSEQIVQAALERASRGRTTIVIAHRLATVRKADNIVVLRKGKVVQQGTHRQLMAEVRGSYYSLASSQNLDLATETAANPSTTPENFGMRRLDDAELRGWRRAELRGVGGGGGGGGGDVTEFSATETTPVDDEDVAGDVDSGYGGPESDPRSELSRNSWYTCSTEPDSHSGVEVARVAGEETAQDWEPIPQHISTPEPPLTQPPPISTRHSSLVAHDAVAESPEPSRGPDSPLPGEVPEMRVLDKHDGWLGGLGGFAELLAEQGSRWKMYAIIVVGALGAGASTPVQAYLFATLLSLFSLWGPDILRVATFFCLMFVALAGGIGISHMVLGWSTTRLGFGLTRFYRKDYFANIITKPSSFFDEEEHSVGTLTAHLATDPTMLQQLLGTNMAFVLVSFFNVVGCIIVGLVFGWKLTVVAIATTMPVVVAAMVYRVRHEVRLEGMANAVFAESAKFAAESIAAIRTVTSLTMEQGITTRYERLLNAHVKKAFRHARWSLFLFSFSDSVAFLCMAFVLWYGGRLLSYREYTPFQYVVVYIAVIQGAMSAGQWLSFGPNIANATAAADRVLDMRDLEDEEHHRGHVLTRDGASSEMTEFIEKEGVDVEFKNVWFSYPTRPGSVLKGLNIKIRRGQFAAIVGPSGSGKTTVISLLERFYSAQTGHVLCNGQDVTTLELAKYRRDISLVAQEAYLFSGSVRDNVLLGVEDGAEEEGHISSTEKEAHREADLQAAMRDAGLHDFVASLPEGYATQVGPRGVALSGGQQQRLSIARALVRHPKLLLLDEATSSLDSETERAVQTTFEAAKGSRTMLVVAHRLATVQNADVIFVMADGKVVEQGDHASLIAQRGVYYQMCQSQALDR